jgi:putative DNA primase/helicase
MPGKWESFAPDRTGPKAIFKDAQNRGWINPASRASRAAYNPAGQGRGDGIVLEKGSNPFDTFDPIRSKASDPSGTPSGGTCLPFDLESFRGKLLEDREITRGNTTTTIKVRIIESLAAEEIAKQLKDKLGLDRETGIWHTFKKSHWQGHEDDAEAVRIIAELVTVGTASLGFRDSYLNGIVNILRKRALLAMAPPPPRTVPFLNGLLDLDTRKITRASPEYAHRWVIPHAYDSNSRCPRFLEWLKEALDNDLHTVETIRAWMSAGLQGVFLQRVLIIHGWGGGGKSAFTTALETVYGEYNIATTTLKSLEQNKFEMFKLVNKRLVQISEAGKHGGDINVLKMLSGGDAVPLEQKHKQQTKSFRYGGLLLIVSNDQLQTTDQTTGLERRRIQVSIKRVFSLEQYEEWREQGGVKAVLQSEPAGIVNWLLELTEEDIHQRIDRLSDRIVKDNLIASAANNACVDWLIHCARPVRWSGSLNDEAHVQIGGAGTKIENGMKVYLDSPDTRAFPNYLRYCDMTRRKPTSHPRFIDTVVEHCHRLGHPVKAGNHSVLRYRALFGLELVREGEVEFDWTSLANTSRDF